MLTTTAPTTNHENEDLTMTTKTATTLADRQRLAAQEAEQLAQQIAERDAARREAEAAALLEAAQTFVTSELPKITDELAAAESRLEALVASEEVSLDQVWTAYLHLRVLSRSRHDRHRVVNGVLDRLDPLPQRLGMEVPRPTVADTWAVTPWPVLVDRVLERHTTRASSTATAEQHAALNAAAAKAAEGYED